MPSLGCNVNEPLMVKVDGACCLKALNTTAIPPNVLEKGKCISDFLNIRCNCPVLFLLTTREGNVFRSVCLVILFTGWVCLWSGVCIWRGSTSGRGRVGIWRGVCIWRGSASEGSLSNPPVLTSSGGHCSSRYTSYWNASLLAKCISYLSTLLRNFS